LVLSPVSLWASIITLLVAFHTKFKENHKSGLDYCQNCFEALIAALFMREQKNHKYAVNEKLIKQKRKFK